MSEIPQKLTVEQQLLVTAVADELSETTSVHQQAVLRMLAVASEHNLNAANLLHDLSVEMKSATAHQIPFVVDDLSSGLSPLESFARTPGIVPESAVMGLETIKTQGLTKPLNQALLNTPNRRKSESASNDNFDAVNSLIWLAFKYLWLINILTFIMLFIIPQFKAMYEEFGIELPLSMQLLVEICNVLTQSWFVFPLIMMVIGAYFLIRHPHIFASFFSRWIPNRWKQPVLTKRAQKDLSLAWVVQTSDELPETAKRFVDNRGVNTEELQRIADGDKAESSTSVLKALTNKRVLSKRFSSIASTASSPESAAWILRKMGKQRQGNRSRRGFNGLRLFFWIGNLFLMVIAAWTAIAIFQSLILIIQGLNKYA